MTAATIRRRSRQRLWPCVPAVIACLLDGGLTLVGQPDAYWLGDYSEVIELNPLGHALLSWHPLAFGIGVLAWIALFCGVLWMVSDRLAVLLSLAITYGHSVGAACWLVRYGPIGWLLAILLLALGSELLSVSWRRAKLGSVDGPDCCHVPSHSFQEEHP